MVVTDVDEVVGTGTEGGDGDGATAVEPSNRFDRIKESYKGVASALDLSEEASAYEDFASLLGDHKVKGSLWPSARPRCAVRAIPQVLQCLPYFWFIGSGACERPRSLLEHRTCQRAHLQVYLVQQHFHEFCSSVQALKMCGTD